MVRCARLFLLCPGERHAEAVIAIQQIKVPLRCFATFGEDLDVIAGLFNSPNHFSCCKGIIPEGIRIAGEAKHYLFALAAHADKLLLHSFDNAGPDFYSVTPRLPKCTFPNCGFRARPRTPAYAGLDG